MNSLVVTAVPCEATDLEQQPPLWRVGTRRGRCGPRCTGLRFCFLLLPLSVSQFAPGKQRSWPAQLTKDIVFSRWDMTQKTEYGVSASFVQSNSPWVFVLLRSAIVYCSLSPQTKTLFNHPPVVGLGTQRPFRTGSIKFQHVTFVNFVKHFLC